MRRNRRRIKRRRTSKRARLWGRRRNARRKSRRIRVKGYLRRRPSRKRRNKRRNIFGLFKRGRRRMKKRGRRFFGRKRRNTRIMRIGRQAFTPARLMRGTGIVVGLGAGAFAKQLVNRAIPANMGWLSRIYGLLSIVAGAGVNMTARHGAIKGAGTGMVAYGILDLLVTNVKPLADFLPQIAGPSALDASTAAAIADAETAEGEYGMGYGRTVGAELPAGGQVEVVGANLQAGVTPELVGCEETELDAYL